MTVIKPRPSFRLREKEEWAIPLLLLILGGFLIRLIQLDGRPFWYDEAFAVLISREGLSAIIEGTLSSAQGAASDVHPPLYYTLLWQWMILFGESVRAVRLLSVLLSTLNMVFVWLIINTAFNRRTGLVAVALYTISPFQVHYGQEARMYILLSLLLLIATFSLLKGLQENGWFAWLALGISSALAMYTHILAAIFLVFLFVWAFLGRNRGQLMKIVSAGLLALLLYSPWLLQLPGQISKVQTSYWIQTPGVTEIIQTLVAFNTGLPLVDNLLPAALLLSMFIMVVLVWRSWSLVRSDNVAVAHIGLIIALAIAPAILLFCISQIWPIYIVRGLLPSGVLYLAWISWLLGHNRMRRTERSLIGGVLALLFVTGLYSHFVYRGFPYAPFEELNQYLESHQIDTGVILHSNKMSMIPAYYYAQNTEHEYLADPPGSASDTLARPTQEVLGLIALPNIGAAVDKHEQVLFIVFDREIQDYLQAGFDQHPGIKFLEERFEIVDTEAFGELRVYEFRRTDLSSILYFDVPAPGISGY